MAKTTKRAGVIPGENPACPALRAQLKVRQEQLAGLEPAVDAAVKLAADLKASLVALKNEIKGLQGQMAAKGCKP